MTKKLERLSGDLRRRGRALLDRYDAENLHQLRVGLRRMRSFLKRRKGSRAIELRHELGKVADTTNAARDWDTLVERAHDELGPRQVRLFETELCRRQADAHQPVLQMLRSPEWSEALDRWDQYLKKCDRRDHGAGGGGKSIAQARTRVDLCWQRASRVGAPRNWHKLRIAIKELRYRLEAHPGKANSRRRELLEQCKQLQSYLGAWHDTVVHLLLVGELAHTYDAGPENRELKVLRIWCRKLEDQGQRCLEATRCCLESDSYRAAINNRNQARGKRRKPIKSGKHHFDT